MKKIIALILTLLLIVLCIYTSLTISEKRTQDKVLAIIGSAQPGRQISEVIDQFWEPSFRTDDVKQMGSGGATVDPAFCRDKILYQYYVTPPCTWVNIYTDEGGVIVFVNWSTS